MALDDIRSALRSGTVEVCHRPVFIIGSPRSGTTALARALAEHPELWTSHESYFLNGLFGDGRASNVYARQSARQSVGWLTTEGVDREEFLAYVGVGLNALYTSRSGGRRWIDQTPLYTLCTEELAELFPDALFVHIVRDGRQVVNSMANFLNRFEHRPEALRHVPGWASDFTEACRTWAKYVTFANSFALDHPRRTFTVINEELAEDPTRCFDGLLRFLDVDPAPQPAAFISSTRVNSSYASGDDLPTEPWDTWDAEQRAVFMAEAGDVLLGTGLLDAEDLQRWADSPAGSRA
jgi:hypothetical protein